MNSTSPVPHRLEGLFTELAKLPDEAARKAFLSRHRRLLRADVVEHLTETVRQRVRVDMEEALGLAEAALAIAAELRDKEALARGLRAKGNALWFKGQCKPAVEMMDQAAALFQEVGNLTEVGRTLSTAIHPLALLGEYDRALSAAQQAREIFSRNGDDRRLARLEINVANILHRQDMFAQALAAYEGAYQQLLPYRDTEGIGVALHNMAVCLIGLNDFYKAQETYERIRTFCQQHDMPLLMAQADYNIAYLYYLRGDYSRALEILADARKACRSNGDAYHLALCNLDQSEIYLELNLSKEAAAVAREAFARFQQLAMPFEAARSLTNLAIALHQQKEATQALQLFSQARKMFVRENNHVWPSLIDMYNALVLYEEGRFDEATRLCRAALEFFNSTPLPDKAVLCHLLLARLALRAGEPTGARDSCRAALEQLTTLEAPVLTFQAHCLMGQVQEVFGNIRSAYDSYQAARRALENLRSTLRGEELKIGFVKNKLDVYESLIRLTISRGSGQAAAEEAFSYMEQAKSRSLRDMIFGRARPLPAKEWGHGKLGGIIRQLREELNWYYHRIDLEQVRQEGFSRERIQQLHSQVQAREDELLRLLRELPSEEGDDSRLHLARAVTLEEIRAGLGPDTILVEYFRVEERFVAAVLTQASLEIVPLTAVSRVNVLLRMLQFQFAKFLLPGDYVSKFQEALAKAAQEHLQQLYQELIAPFRPRLQARHLVVVPHDALHHLPFHALFDGKQYLIDNFAVSYSPSASIYALCQRRSVHPRGQALVLGVPDPQAPFIREEVHSVAAALSDVELFLGPDASEEVLRKKGPQSRIVHIATHGCFRRDNPMFSGIRLGGSHLTIFDLYSLNLPVELLTVSGCATGLNVVAAGDEALGLVRGLLCAGAQSLLLTLWDVHDRSTADLMKSFYSHLQTRRDKAQALRGAMMELRDRHPHPYFWAPFILVGKALSS